MPPQRELDHDPDRRSCEGTFSSALHGGWDGIKLHILDSPAIDEQPALDEHESEQCDENSTGNRDPANVECLSANHSVIV